jgi:hypothetical protein
MPHRVVRSTGVAALLALLAACGHVEPGAPSDSGSTGPFAPGNPLRLTLNPGRDLWPAWTDDGSAIWYVYQDLGRADRDYCLGKLPAAGGSRTVSFCQVVPPAADDSLDVAISPAPRGDRLAWFRVHSRANDLVPTSGELMLGPAGDLDAAVPLVHFPFQTPAGSIQSFGQDLQWLDDSTLLYAGTQVRVTGTPPTDTSYTGAGLTLVHLTGAGATVEILPGATDAASAGAGTAAGELYFTRTGDSRIYRMRLPDSTAGAVYDFGAGVPVRDVRVLGSRMVAVVGNSGGDPLDAGGAVYLVTDTIATPLLSTGAWRHPAFRPDGHALAVTRSDGAGLDDLYLIPLP